MADFNELENITAPTESTSTASATHAQGSYLIYDGKLYQATANIAIGDTLATTGAGANIAQVTGGAMGEVTDLKSAFDVLYPEVSPTLEYQDNAVGISSTTGKIQIVTKANYKYAVYPTQEGDVFLITGYCNSTNYPLVRFADNDNVQKGVGCATVGTYTKEKITAPAGTTRAYFNNRYETTPISVIKVKNTINELETVLQENTSELQNHETRIQALENTTGGTALNKLVLASVNCGTFNRNHDDTFPDNPDYDYYTNEWRKMISNTQFDIFCLEDYTQWFDKDSTINAQNNLFHTMIKNHIDKDGGLRVETKTICEDLGLLEVTGSSSNPFIYNGQSYTSNRRFAQRTRVYIAGHEVVIYSLHFVSGTTGGYPGAFRHQQFIDLMDDAENYENVVFIGDFNCHQISEYSVFTENGYIISNGGYLGMFLTLRDAYADNIIVSPNLCVDDFNVLSTYDLSTDHYPVMGTIRYIGI